MPGHIGNTTVHITAAERTAWNNKVDKVEGKGLSSNDFTTAEKEKLAGIAAGATNVVVDSALSATSTNAVQNKAVYAALQGMDNCTTTFNADGSISATYGDGSVNTTVFNADGSITDTFANGAMNMQKKTIFNADGSISEVLI